MRGGARNRSGPQKDENSGRSDRTGYSLTALPPAGFDGEVPEFPLPDAAAAALIGTREQVLWVQHWRTPQACAWSLEPWRWETVAEFCRIKAIVELAPDASAALVDKLRMYRDQIGLTPAGLKENGWKIAEPPKADGESPPTPEGDDEDDPRNRLTVVPDAETG